MHEPTQHEILNRYRHDERCAGCKGKGVRSGGRCRACNGRGFADLKHPRIRFNWGYHDGAADAKRGAVREIVWEGDHTLCQVSIAFDFWYAYGYRAGVEAERTRVYAGDSSNAWRLFTQGQLPE